ncbi:MAG: secretion protein [Planctomycetes bacterium]|nr:secretion protein [Planctomycetota bacterium]
MTLSPMLISVAAFLGVTSLVAAIFHFVRSLTPTTPEERLEVLVGKKSASGEGANHRVTKDELIRDAFSPIANVVGGLGERFANLALFFEQADSPISIDAFVGLSLGAAAIGVVAAWASGSPPPLYPVAALALGMMPFLWLFLRRRRRLKKFAHQLPDALELIGRALRSGHSLAAALHLVHQEMPDPIGTEFGMAYEEQNLGIPIEKALKNTLKRVPNMDLKFFVTAVAIQRQSGGDLAEIIDKISYIIRERFKIMGQVAALTGEGRLSGVVLMGLPIVLFLAVYQINPDYVMLLFTDPIGKKMLAAAAVLQIIGALVIKKIVAIKV